MVDDCAADPTRWDSPRLDEQVAVTANNGWAPSHIVIVDDHELFSTSLMIALRELGHQACIAPVAGLPELAARPPETRPAIVVLDLNLGIGSDGRKISGCDWITRLSKRGWPVLAVTGSDRDSDVVAAIAEGAAGVVLKSSPLEELLNCVVLTARGEPLISEPTRREYEAQYKMVQERRRSVAELLGRLSSREREVLESIADGMHAAAIAQRSIVSLATVRTQIRAILRKLEVNSQIEAIALLRESHDI